MAVILLTLDHTSIVDQLFKARLAGEAEPGFEDVVARRLPDLDGLGSTMAATDAWRSSTMPGAPHRPIWRRWSCSNSSSDEDDGRMTKGQMLAHVITHGASHRGAIGKMLEGLEPARRAPSMVTTFQRGRG